MAVSGKVRATGAKAVIGRTGQADIVSATGAKVTLSSALSTPGYSPVDLFYASIAGCIVLSVRIAASERHLLDKLTEVRAEVRGHKAAEPRPRITRLDITIEVDGDFDEATKHALIERGEELCTVSNTVREPPEFVTNRH
jgi:uncharacterized OsmC-like protein